MQTAHHQQPQNRGAQDPMRLLLRRWGEPFRVTFTGNGIDIGGRLTSQSAPTNLSAPSKP